MGYRYRRETNIIGWLTFLTMGGIVFAGLLFALWYFKGQAELKDKKAQAALPQTNHPTLGREPETVVKEQLVKLYKKEGKAMEARYGHGKEVQSQKFNRPVVIILVQHREAGSDGDYTADVFVLDRTKISKVSAKDWPKAKGEQFGIAEDPPEYTPVTD